MMARGEKSEKTIHCYDVDGERGSACYDDLDECLADVREALEAGLSIEITPTDLTQDEYEKRGPEAPDGVNLLVE